MTWALFWFCPVAEKDRLAVGYGLGEEKLHFYESFYIQSIKEKQQFSLFQLKCNMTWHQVSSYSGKNPSKI